MPEENGRTWPDFIASFPSWLVLAFVAAFTLLIAYAMFALDRRIDLGFLGTFGPERVENEVQSGAIENLRGCLIDELQALQGSVSEANRQVELAEGTTGDLGVRKATFDNRRSKNIPEVNGQIQNLLALASGNRNSC